MTGVTSAGAAAVVTSTDHSGYDVRHNYIHDNELGVWFRSNGNTQSVVQSNLFEDNDLGNGLGTAKAINNDGGLANALIEDNVFVGHTEGDDSYSIQLVKDEPHADVVIRGNEMQSTIVVVGYSNVSLSNNVVDMSNDPDSTSAIFIGGEVDGADVKSNTLRNADRGLGVFDVFGGPNSNITVADNAFRNNTVQVRDQDQVLDMPVVRDNNAFDKAIVVDNASTGLLPTIWSRVQHGIDNASSGDTVSLEPGRYVDDGTIRVTKDIDLVGSGQMSTTVYANSSTVTSNQRPTIQIAADATIKNLTIIREITLVSNDRHTKALGITREDDGEPTDAVVRETTVRMVDTNGSDEFGNAVWVSNFNAVNGVRYEVNATLDNVTAENIGVGPDSNGFGGGAVAVFAADKNVSVNVKDSGLDNSARGLYTLEDNATVSVQVTGSVFRNNTVQIVDNAESLDLSRTIQNNQFDQVVVVDRPESSMLHTVWSSIQDAVNASQGGDIVEVLPGTSGTYDEDVAIEKNVTVVGFGATIDGRVDVKSDGVALLGETAGGLTITNASPDSQSRVDGILVSVGTDDPDELVIIRNVTITGLRNQSTSNAVEAIHIFDEADGVLIEDVTISDIYQPVAGAAGVKIQAGVSNVTVRDSIIDHIRGSQSYGVVAAPSSDLSLGFPEKVNVSANRFDNITANTYAGVGVGVDSASGGFSDTGVTPGNEVRVRCNVFENLETGVLNKDTGGNTTNATVNWWGAPNGPGNKSGDGVNVTGDVDFEPFLGRPSCAPYFDIGVLSVNSPTEGGTVDAKFRVENLGGFPQTQTVSLRVAEVGNNTDIRLGPRETLTLELSWATGSGDAGSYVASGTTANDSSSASFNVWAPATPTAVESDDGTIVFSQQLQDDAPDEPGTTVHFEAGQVDGEIYEPPIEEIIFEDDISATQTVEVSTVAEQPSPEEVDEDVVRIMRTFRIDAPPHAEDRPATIRFSVSQARLGDRSPEAMMLARQLDDGSWELYEATPVDPNADPILFEVDINGFSKWSVVIRPMTTPTATSISTPPLTETATSTESATSTFTPTRKTAMTPTKASPSPAEGPFPQVPGFGFSIAIVALIATAAFALRRETRG